MQRSKSGRSKPNSVRTSTRKGGRGCTDRWKGRLQYNWVIRNLGFANKTGMSRIAVAVSGKWLSLNGSCFNRTHHTPTSGFTQHTSSRVRHTSSFVAMMDWKARFRENWNAVRLQTKWWQEIQERRGTTTQALQMDDVKRWLWRKGCRVSPTYPHTISTEERCLPDRGLIAWADSEDWFPVKQKGD